MTNTERAVPDDKSRSPETNTGRAGYSLYSGASGEYSTTISSTAHHSHLPHDTSIPVTRTARRGRPLTVSRDDIIRVASHQIMELGPSKFSMKTVADEFGVTSMALYHHFKSKDALISAVYMHLIDSAPQIDLPEDKRERLVALAVLMVNQLDGFPYAMQMMISEQKSPVLTGWAYDMFSITAYEAGVDPLQIAVTIQAIRRVVCGEVIARHTTGRDVTRPPYWHRVDSLPKDCPGSPEDGEKILNEAAELFDIAPVLGALVDRMLAEVSLPMIKARKAEIEAAKKAAQEN